MTDTRTTPDLGQETRAVARAFRDSIGPAALRRTRRTADPGISPDNIVVLLPFALADAFPFDGCAEAARTMARGNVLGAAHFLLQDRQVDGDEDVSPGAARLGDRTLLGFAREYARLFAADSGFWEHFDRYVTECLDSLAWEERVLRGADGAAAVAPGALPATLTELGHRMAPLKATAAAVCALSGRGDALAPLELVVDRFHAAYQLSDDLADLPADLAAGRWSAASWLFASRSGLSSPADEPDAGRLMSMAARSGALDELADLVHDGFAGAADLAGELEAPILEGYLRTCLRRADRLHGWTCSRLRVGENGPGEAAVTPEAAPRLDGRLHTFEVRGSTFVYDSASGLFFEADGLAADAVRWSGSGDAATLDVLRMNYGPDCVDDVLSELAIFGRGRVRRANPRDETFPSLTSIACVALNVTGECNLTCDYCYLSRDGSARRARRGGNGSGAKAAGERHMSRRTAVAAIDLLFDESFGERRLAVVFFGGEPLLRPSLIARASRYARDRARAEGKTVSFHATTNGTLLTRRVAEMLRSSGVRVLVSVDGNRAEHDAHRRFRSGGGSYDLIASNLSRLPEGMRVGARVTVSEGSRSAVETVEHLRSLGLGTVHLSPVSGAPMSREFADRLALEFEELAARELRSVSDGAAPLVGNFVEPVLSLEMGRQRLRPCGAGARYLSVGHGGELFLCHRFAGDARFGVGDVQRGLDRFAVGRLLALMERRSEDCDSCWALDLCGGACFHDVENGDGSQAARCSVIRRIFELSMWIYASLPPARRTELTDAAKRAARPEMGV